MTPNPKTKRPRNNGTKKQNPNPKRFREHSTNNGSNLPTNIINEILKFLQIPNKAAFVKALRNKEKVRELQHKYPIVQTVNALEKKYADLTYYNKYLTTMGYGYAIPEQNNNGLISTLRNNFLRNNPGKPLNNNVYKRYILNHTPKDLW